MLSYSPRTTFEEYYQIRENDIIPVLRGIQTTFEECCPTPLGLLFQYS